MSATLPGAVIDPETLARRRHRLMGALGDGLLLLPTAPHLVRNGDTHHEFRPSSDFEHLCGFPEPESTLVIAKRGKVERAILFVPPRDKEREVWDGKRHGPEGARRRFGVDAAHPSSELWKMLPELLFGHARVFTTLGKQRAFDEALFKAFERVAAKQRRNNPPAHPQIVDPLPALAELRKVKDAREVELLTRAAEITATGHLAAMRCVRPGMREYEVQAELERAFRMGGSRRNGYNSIVAGGKNACILHYVENDQKLRAGDLLLIDAGAEFAGYTADVTRTFPVTGKFTPAQREVYAIVLRAQLRAIAAVRPGAAWNAPHLAATKELTRGLVALGILKGRIDAVVKKSAYRPWYMHGTSHWLGRDVHDVGAYQDAAGKPVRLRPGNVLTIEPGLYLPADDARVPKRYRGIGIRIEDDVLVTPSGHRVLTAAIAKRVADLELAIGASH